MENVGADPLHAMAMDHAKYRDALKNHLVIRGVLDALCMQEWNVTCEVRFPIRGFVRAPLKIIVSGSRPHLRVGKSHLLPLTNCDV